jgi:hypothetical protein
MESLHKMTPEQLKALSPECLLLLINSDDDINADIIILKNYFSSLKYYGGNQALYDKKKALIAKEILSKHSDKQFYLTCDYEKQYCDLNAITNWKLHTEDEIKLLIPTGLDIDKIICSGNTKKQASFFCISSTKLVCICALKICLDIILIYMLSILIY